MARTLPELFQYLDSLRGRAPLERLIHEVRELQLDLAELAEYTRFAAAHYQRNLVKAGPWYNVWVMCWKNGQRSPIHDHGSSSCALRVLRGTLTETLFAFAPNGHVKATGSRELGTGELCGTQEADLHQISNLQAGDADLITFHVYSPPLLRMGTFSLTDLRRGEDIWVEERRVITRFPENSEMPLDSVRGWVTSNRLFFVRNHFDVPFLDRSTWRLRVEGLVGQARAWTWEELTALPERSVFATVECAGNGRSFLRERAPGVQWGAGAIGHAEWTGVPMHVVLEQSGIQPGATEVLFEGCDQGTEPDHPEPMHFARSLPLAKALHPDTLLAYRMNGEWLSPSHGYPLRLFVPGWYGVASVKWLQRIEVRDRFYPGYYQTTKYTIQEQTAEGLKTVVLGPMAVKSEIVRPAAGATLAIGTSRVFGTAWAGEESVTRVEVSTDGGLSWSPAQLIGPRAPYCWTLWEYLWEVARPGSYTLMARAFSEGGRTQPLEYDPLYHGYMIHFSRPVAVDVREAARPSADLAADFDTLLYDMNAYAEEMSHLQLDVEMEFSAGEGI